ncbi:MAG TPA: DUF6518 family protein [Opitutaceae bacterium]|nr:DUF6518 family protein [Opitutaceae bacterium]
MPLRAGRPGTASRLMVAVAAGLAVGALTLWSVLHLPFSVEPLSNTAAPWILVTSAVALCARGRAESLVLAIVTLLALVLGFYVAEAIRGWGVSRHQLVFWSAMSVLVGPLVGLAADWLRRSGRTARALSVGILGGLLAGEAVYGLMELKFSSPARYWYVQFALGIALAVGLPLWDSRRRWLSSGAAVSVSAAVFAVVGLGTFVAYQIT